MPKLDENGNPILHKRGEPAVDVIYKVDFTPTPEQLKRYKKLSYDYSWAKALGKTDEAERLKAERDALEASAQRLRPSYTVSSGVGAEAKAKSDGIKAHRYHDVKIKVLSVVSRDDNFPSSAKV